MQAVIKEKKKVKKETEGMTLAVSVSLNHSSLGNISVKGMLNLNCTKPLKLNKAVKGGRYKGLGEYKTLGENEAVKTNRWENRRGTTGKGKIRLRQEEKVKH